MATTLPDAPMAMAIPVSCARRPCSNQSTWALITAISTSRNAWNSGVPFSDFITAGIGRADVWVFNALNLGTALGAKAAEEALANAGLELRHRIRIGVQHLRLARLPHRRGSGTERGHVDAHERRRQGCHRGEQTESPSDVGRDREHREPIALRHGAKDSSRGIRHHGHMMGREESLFVDAMAYIQILGHRLRGATTL